MEVFVEVYAHAIWMFVVFWSDLVAQLEVRFRLKMMDSSSGSVTDSVMIMGCTRSLRHLCVIAHAILVIADVIAHAIDPPLLFSLHRQAEEL